MNRFRKNVKKKCRKLRKFHKLPTTVLELHDCVRIYSLKTISSENFVFYNDKVSKVIIFTYTQNLDTFQHATTVFVDGTFKSTPKLFCQMFIAGNFYISVVFSLLPNETIETYKLLWISLHHTCQMRKQFLQILNNLYILQSLRRGYGQKSEDTDFIQLNRGGGKFKFLVCHQISKTTNFRNWKYFKNICLVYRCFHQIKLWIVVQKTCSL